MNKRELFGAALGGALLAGSLPGQAAAPSGGPALLTVTGAIGKTNRGPLDPVLDQMMAKQKIAFDKAHAFDFNALAALPAVTIKPTLEYDGKSHVLKGPLLADVLKAAGATGTRLLLRAVDGYSPAITVQEATRLRFIVATHLDGKPMPLGGLGPLWAIYEADSFPEMAAKKVTERFGPCPWGLYHIDVQA